MTWTKELPGSATASVENRDLKAALSFDDFTELERDEQGDVVLDEDDEPVTAPVEALRCDFTIAYDGAEDVTKGFRPHDPDAADDDPPRPTALTAAQEATFKSLLAKLRDHAMYLDGCTEG
jgi:hypothetical protein